MTAKEGLARLRAVRATLGEPGEWPEAIRKTDEVRIGCLAQSASGCNFTPDIEHSLGFDRLALIRIYEAYDARDPVALDAALDALEREIAANE